MQVLRRVGRLMPSPRPVPTIIQHVIVVLFWMLPLMDALTGWLWWNGVRESIVFKYPIALMALVLATALIYGAYGKGEWVLLGTIAVIGGVNLLVNMLWMPEFAFNTYGITGLAGIAFAQSVYSMLKKRIATGETFHRILRGVSFIAPLTLIVPQLLGVGYPAYFYGEGHPANYGYLGFYASSNEINAALIICLGYCFSQLYKRQSWQMLLAAAFLTYSSCQIQSRSSIVLCAVEWFAFLIALVLQKDRKKQFLISMVVCASLVILLIPDLKAFAEKQVQSLENTPIEMENRLENNLTNGRFDRIWDTPELMDDSVKDKEEFQSMQLYPWIGSFFSNYEVLGISEMDFVDALKGFGVFGCVLFCAFYGWAGLRTYFAQRRLACCFGLLCVYAFAFLTGHILFTWSQVMYLGIYATALMTGPIMGTPRYWRWLPPKLRGKLDAANFAVCE